MFGTRCGKTVTCGTQSVLREFGQTGDTYFLRQIIPWDKKCSPWIWTDRRYIFSATNYYMGQKVFSVNLGRPEIHIFCEKLLHGTKSVLREFGQSGDTYFLRQIITWDTNLGRDTYFPSQGERMSSYGTDGLPGPTKIPLIYKETQSWEAVSQILHQLFEGVTIWWSTSMRGRRRQIHPDGSRADCYFGVPSFYSTQASGLCAVCGPFVILLLPYTAPNGLLLWQTYFVLTQAAVQHQEHLNCTHDQGSSITNKKR